MIFDNIKRLSLGSVFLSLLMLVGFCSNTLLNPPEQVVWNNSIFLALPVIPEIVYVIVAILLVLLTGLLLCKIVDNHMPLKRREPLLLLFWTIITGAYTFLHSLSEIHFAVLFVLLSYNKLFSTSKDVDRASIFLSSMYLGVALLFYSYAVYIYIPLFFSTVKFQPITIKSIIISVVGFLAPLYFSTFFFFFFKDDWFYPIATTINNIIPSFPISLIEMSVFQYIATLFLILLIVFSLALSVKQVGGRSLKSRYCNFSFFNLLVFSAAILLVFPQNKSTLLILLIPATMLITNIFVRIKRDLYANLLFAAIFAVCVCSCFL